ncbi:preprotein translocase subunit SecE [Porticoccaceae bacterium]|jgi:preprotein translocase subunit SecE|nr:preprotein translocase subunit SecE [Porticoccaceae bacterium]MDC0236625.1 preprotein translocase subunit SecE [Gammaproteobacteria bacterium]MDA8879377.1 preprotein translocase subunit SecE [Porticoccaceae bacterium]MDA9583368.1 preprotein translocase subunit SecE [Porticoccaceae bacterium]MDB2395916.1 preprotein translocase subunit SecE [Porticoccaceae bacterium]|tara:strand:- start:171 stop:539 length:369 start_codon:yes stop_codon:yes gene_type:complete
MSVIAEDKQYRLDWLKWLVVFTLLGGAIYANWYYSAESVLYRVIGFLVVLAIAAAVASQTAKGAATIELAIGARTEWRKVVWPTKQERNQTTLIVLAVILLMALILWGIDSLLSWVAKLIMG